MQTKKKVVKKKAVRKIAKRVVKKIVKKTMKKPVLTQRTQAEIVARIEFIKADDFFGFETSDLIDFLDYEHAKPYIKPEVTKEQWEKRDHKTPEEHIKSYMNFAWDKANNKRGLSAGRSVSHYRSWTWLACNDELLNFINSDNNYAPYGKPILAKICEYYKLPNEDNGDKSTS